MSHHPPLELGWRTIARPVVVGLLALAIGGLALACRDELSPAQHTLPPETSARVTIPDDSALRALESPATASGHITILPSGVYDTWPLLGYYPTTTIVRSEITGQAIRTHPSDPDRIFTPKGYNDNCGSERLLLSTGWSECSGSRFRAVQGEVKLFASIYPGYCTNYGTVCSTYSGGFDAQQERLDASLEIWPADTTVLGGTSATIRWRATPDSLQGLKTPLSAKRVFFEPDSDGVVADTALECHNPSGYFYQTNSCTIRTRGSGTLHVWAIVNGKLEHKTAHVTAPTLELIATPRYGKQGDTITFTPRWSDGASVTQTKSWTWTPDSVPGATAACTYGTVVCKTKVQESGTMRVSITIGDLTYTASAHVNVNKCPDTGDHRLDSPDVRAGFILAMKASNPDSAPGAGYDPANWQNTGFRKEQAVWLVYRRSDGTFYTVYAAGTSTGCSFHPTAPPSVGGDSIVALMHTHPSKASDPVYGDCKVLINGQLVSVKRFPSDVGRQGYAGNDANDGGGSFFDWQWVADSNNVFFRLDAYVMNSAGDVWRLPSGWTWSQRRNDRQTRRKKWASSACTWP